MHVVEVRSTPDKAAFGPGSRGLADVRMPIRPLALLQMRKRMARELQDIRLFIWDFLVFLVIGCKTAVYEATLPFTRRFLSRRVASQRSRGWILRQSHDRFAVCMDATVVCMYAQTSAF